MRNPLTTRIRKGHHYITGVSHWYKEGSPLYHWCKPLV
jgi:hypothetical protein